MATLLAIGLALLSTHTSAQTSADLIVGGLSLTPSVAASGDVVTGFVTVRNAGTGQADPSTVGLYLVRWGAPLTEAAALGTLMVRSLAPGVSVQLPLSFPVPAVAPGYFQVIAMADVAGVVTERSDANNRRAARLQVAVPDLVVNWLSVTPGTARAGDTVTVRVRVRNQGRVPADDSEGAVYFVSSPTTVMQGATPMLTFPVAKLLPGASAETVLALPVPSASPGSYTIVARADSTTLVAEGSESNNLRGAGLRIASPNLTITGFTATPNTVGVGQTIRGSVWLQNRAPVSSYPTTATLYVATAPDADLATATLVGTVPVPEVLPNRVAALSVPVVVPPLSQGDQYLIVQVDATSAIGGAPSMLASASFAGPSMTGPRRAVRLSVRLADLIISQLTPGSTRLHPGTTMTAMLTVRNAGSVVSASSLSALLVGACASSGAVETRTLQTVPTPPLPPGASTTHTITATVPTLDPGSYCLIGRADSPGTLTETVETNNDRSVAVTIGSGTITLSPTVDPSQMDVPWGWHSHYKQPWRGWLETVPGHVVRDGVGINYKWFQWRESHDVAMRLLAEAGFSRIRLELNWGHVIDYDTGDLKPDARARLTEIAVAAKTHGIRPLILLNAYHGLPVPSRRFTRTVSARAPAGSSSLVLNDVADVSTNYTGLSNLTGFRMSEVLVTRVDPAARKVFLSKPLPVTLNAGDAVTLDTLKYLPLYETGMPQHEETVGGWVQFARAVCRALTATGVAGFDVEIWNELTFGSDFISIANYYDPPIVRDPWERPNTSLQPGGPAWELANRTVRMLAAEFPNAVPIWGFSNTTFYHTDVTDLPPGTRGQTYHPYFFVYYDSLDDEQLGFESNLEGYAPKSPPYRVLMPEGAGTYVRTESLTRLINPVDRRIRPSGSATFHHYMTEFGFDPATYGVVDPSEGQLTKAKTVLRGSLFWLNKGLKAIWFYADFHGGEPEHFDLSLDLLPSWVADLRSYPADPDSALGPPLRALRNLSAMFAGATTLASTRQLDIEAAAADGEGGGLIFSGDASHPSFTYQDALAVLPFQVDERSFIVALYVMSRNITQGLPETPFVLRVANVAGTAARLRYVNPLTGLEVPLQVLERTDTSLLVSVPVADFPYLLEIRE